MGALDVLLLAAGLGTRLEPLTLTVAKALLPIYGVPLLDYHLSRLLGPDGAAYGVTGRDGQCEAIRFDPGTEKYELLGPVADGDIRCWQVHDVAVADDGTSYDGENDNPYRSGYLWEIAL